MAVTGSGTGLGKQGGRRTGEQYSAGNRLVQRLDLLGYRAREPFTGMTLRDAARSSDDQG